MVHESQALPCQCWIDFCEIWNWGVSYSTFVNILQCWLKVDSCNTPLYLQTHILRVTCYMCVCVMNVCKMCYEQRLRGAKMVSVSGVRRLSVPLLSGSDVMNDRPVLCVGLLCCSFGWENMWVYKCSRMLCRSSHQLLKIKTRPISKTFNFNWNFMWLIA